MLKNTLSAALVLAIVGTGALVAPPVAASAATVSPAATVAASSTILEPEVIEHGDDMVELSTTPASKRNLAKAQDLPEKAGTVGSPEVHPLYYSVTATTTQTTDDDIADLDETSLRALTDRLSAYWFAESGGTIRFTWGGIETRSVSATTCDPNAVYSSVSQAAFGGIFANSAWAGTSRHLIILAKEKAACGGGQAFGAVAGDVYRGGLIFSSQGSDLALGTPTLEHELGHNLGFRHASASICRSTTNFDSTIDQIGLGASGQQLENTTMQCPTEDYGDLLDIMGYTVTNSNPHLSTALRITNNFMTDYTTVTPSTSGTFTIAPINNTATGGAVRALRIKDPTTGEYYYVEYRTKTGADSDSYSFLQSPTLRASVDGYSLAPYEGTDATANGAVRIQRMYTRGGYFGTTALAVAPTKAAPGNLQVRRPYLVPGQTFTNDKNIFTVTVNSTNTSGGANVTVAFKVPTRTTLFLNPSSQNYGATGATAQAVVSKVDGVTVPGTVTITADGTTVGTGAVDANGGFAVSLPSSLSLGTHNIKASFAPSSGTYLASESANSTLTVNAAPTTTTLSLNNSANQAYNQGARVTASASVAKVGSSYPAGSIEFRDGSTVLGTVATDANGAASYTFAADLSVGTHSVTARFVPSSSTVAASTSSAATLTVTATPTSVGLTLDRSATQVFGSATPVTAQASVAELSTGGYAPGSVEFRDGSTVRATVPVNASGIASYTFSATLGTGSHDITARFVPTSSNVATSTSVAKTLTVTASPTTTIVTLDKSGTQVFGSSTRVVATASVAQVAGDYPAGTITFRDGTTTLDTVTVSAAGTATFSFPASTTAGSHSITAIFTPASVNYQSSTSSSSTLTVSPAATSTALTLDNGATQVYLGARATATATVAPVGGVYPAGQIEFREGSSVLATVSVSSEGVATYTLAADLAAGTHDISARFVPATTNYVTSSSTAATLTVTAAPTSSSLALDRSSTQVFATATPVTGTATIAPVNGVTPAGAFQFLDGTTVLATVSTNASGVATYTFADSTAVGGHSITVRFVPTNSSFASSTSSARTLTVTAATTGTVVALDRSGTQVFGSGDTVTATANVSAVAGVYPAGSIEFRDGSTVLATVSSSGTGTASYTFAPNTAAGSHSITAKFVPTSSNYDGSTSAAKTLTVSPTPTTVAFTLDRGATQVYGSSSPVTAQASVAELAQGGYAAGSIEFLDGSTVRGTVPVSSGGIATFTFSSALQVGDHTITVRFVPSSANIAGSTSLARTLTVTKAPTATSLTLDRSGEQTFAAAQRVTATATVAEVNGAIQPGTIEFRDGATVLDTVTVSASGIATYTFPASVTAGSHSISAVFSPTSGSYAGSISTSSILTVRAAQTATSLSLSQGATQVYLDSATSTATATIAAISGVVPEGQVEFREGSSVLATVATNASGVATYALSSTLTYGSHNITARFIPRSTNYLTSTSDASALAVTSSPSSTSLVLSQSAQSYATTSPVTLTATVATVKSVVPTGSIQFYDDTTLLGTVAANTVTGSASLTVPSTLVVGSHPLTARFVPSEASFTTSSSAVRPLAVNAAATSTTITLDRSGTQVYKSPDTVAITAKVAAVAGVFPSGDFVVLDGSTVIATVASGASGTATFAGSSTLALGSHTVTVRFEPTSANYATSTSAGSTLWVVPSPTTIALTISNGATQQSHGPDATATAQVSEVAGGGYAPGLIRFRKNGTVIVETSASANGSATITLPNYAPGTYSITAEFSPQTSAASSSTSAVRTFTVTAAPTETAVTFDNSATQVYSLNPRVTATASVTSFGRGDWSFPGSVTFYDNGAVLASGVTIGTGGKATYLFPATTEVGSHTITAVYNATGTETLGSTSNEATMTVTSAPVSTSILETSMQQVYLTSSATATAQVAIVGTGYPAGQVEFRDGSALLATVAVSTSNGRAVYSFPTDTAVGTHSITARFTPSNPNYTGSTSAAKTLTVVPAQTTTTLTFNGVNGFAYGATETVTATGQSSQVGGSYQAGSIQFLDGSTVLASVGTNAAGSASYTFASDLVAGSHSITARFVAFSASIGSSTSTARNLTVSKAVAPVTFTLDKSTQSYGSATPAVATASVPKVNGAYPTGTVTFRDGTTPIATVAMSDSGTASTPLPAFVTAGSRSITAVFEPANPSISTSTSTARTLTVSTFATTTALVLDNSATQVYNSANRVTATASLPAYGAGGYPTGTIEFRDGSNSLGTVTVSGSGVASYTFDSTLAAGTHTITAVFTTSLGSVTGSTSTARVLTVAKAATSTSLALSDGAQQDYGSSSRVTATATVTASNGDALTGTVTFRDGSTALETVALDANGQASTTFPAATAAGAHNITAVFVPTNGSYASSTSAARVLTVVGAGTSTSLALDQASQDYLGDTVTTATARAVLAGDGTAEGVIEFLDGTTVLATVPTGTDGYASYEFASDLAVGAHSITARFLPSNPSISSSTSAASGLQVFAGSTTTQLELDGTASQPLGTDSPVTATATISPVRGVHPAGVVQFRDGSTVLETVPADQSGIAAFTLPAALTVGEHSISARFVPATTSFTGSTSTARTLTVTPGLTVTAITLSRDGIQSHGSTETVVVTANVARVAGVFPAGEFVFRDGESTLATVAAGQDGAATYSALPSLAVGAHAITAEFVPTSTSYLGSTSDSATLTVSSSASRVTIEFDKDSQVYADPDSATIIATVDDRAGGTLAGTVTFYDGQTVLGTDGVNENGNAYYRFATDLGFGPHSITAKFAPDSAEVTGSTSTARTFSVRAVGTTTELSLEYGSSQSYGSSYPVTVYALVSRDDFESVEGTLTFFSGATALGTVTVVPGYTSFVIPKNLAAGSHEITARLTPTSPVVASGTSNAVTVTVLANDTQTYLSFDRQWQYFQSANRARVTAQVSTFDGAMPTGRVEFTAGSSVIGTADLVADSASNPYTPTATATLLVPSNLAIGDYTIRGRYISTDPSILGSSSQAAQFTVNETPVATGLALGLALDRSAKQVFGSASTVTATATVTVSSGELPAGSVTFFDGQTELGTVAGTTSGVVTFALPKSLAGGDHTISARFTPTSSSLSAVTSGALQLTVSQATPTITATLDRSATQVYGAAQTVTVTATVAAVEGHVPAGQFLFRDGSTDLSGFISTSGGSATFALPSSLAVGTHNISVIFSSQSSSISSGVSSAAVLTVTGAATATALSLDASGTQAFGDARTVTATATVARVGGEQPAGVIRFRDGGSVIATVRLTGTGSASYTFPATFSVGTHAVTAVFEPDEGSNFSGSTSTARTLTVTSPTATTTTVALSNASQVFGTDSPVTVTAAVAAGAVSPAGTVEFFVDGSSIGSKSVNGTTSALTLSGTLTAGLHTVRAKFTATSTEFSVSENEAVLEVAQLSVPVTLTATRSSQTYGSTTRATLTASIDQAVLASAGGGTVTFKKGGATLSTVVVPLTGKASYVLAATTAVGTATYTATFTPADAANVTGRTSTDIVSVKVSAAKSTVSLSLKSSSVKVKKTSTATVTVKVSGVTAPTGTITLYSGTKKLKAYTLSASKKGKLTITVPAFSKKATAKLKVVYGGTTNITKSTSSTKSLKVK